MAVGGVTDAPSWCHVCLPGICSYISVYKVPKCCPQSHHNDILHFAVHFDLSHSVHLLLVFSLSTFCWLLIVPIEPPMLSLSLSLYLFPSPTLSVSVFIFLFPLFRLGYKFYMECSCDLWVTCFAAASVLRLPLTDNHVILFS